VNARTNHGLDVLESLCSALLEYDGTNRRTGGAVVSRTIGDNLLRIARAAVGDVNPVGDEDEKTASPGSYGPIVGTCSVLCRFRPISHGGTGEGCYGTTGNVGTHERRARPERLARWASWAVAVRWAVLTGRKARLHVVGDVMESDGLHVDRVYVIGLCTIAKRLGGSVSNVVGWGYTAATGDDRPMAEWAITVLASAGVVLRHSSHAGPRGAIAWPFARIGELKRRHPRAAFVFCPAQLSDRVSCANDCGGNAGGLCWSRPERTIVFDPHGNTTAATRAALDLSR
jgi:class 3 adenylate cyclase